MSDIDHPDERTTEASQTSWIDQFPIEYEGVDVTLNRLGTGELEVVLDVDDGHDIVIVEPTPDMTYEQLVERGKIDL